MRQIKSKLSARIAGRALHADDVGFDDAKNGFYPQDDISPQIVVYCHEEADVAAALEVAREENIPFAIRSGGHSIAGFSTCNGMIIDVSAINAVYVDNERNLVRVGAGVKLGVVSTVLERHGLHIPVGCCETVAIAGFMQGGGYGYTSRAYGMNCDLVREFRIMLANGEVVTANATHHADLFWAVRGGEAEALVCFWTSHTTRQASMKSGRLPWNGPWNTQRKRSRSLCAIPMTPEVTQTGELWPIFAKRTASRVCSSKVCVW